MRDKYSIVLSLVGVALVLAITSMAWVMAIGVLLYLIESLWVVFGAVFIFWLFVCYGVFCFLVMLKQPSNNISIYFDE